MIERIEKLEEALKVVLYAYEQNQLFIESNTTTMDSALDAINTIPEFMNDTDKRIRELQGAFVNVVKGQEAHMKIIESQGRTIKKILETLEIMQKR